MNQETKETEQEFTINPEDVAAGRIFICRNGARVTLKLGENLRKDATHIWYVREVITAANSCGPREGWNYTARGYWLGHLRPSNIDIFCLETLAEPEIKDKSKPTPRKSFIRTGVIKSVRAQKNGNYTVTVDMTDTPDTGIRRIVLNLPSSKLKAHQRVGFSFRTSLLITDKTEFADGTAEI